MFRFAQHLADDLRYARSSLEPDLVFVDFFLISSTFGFSVDFVDELR